MTDAGQLLAQEARALEARLDGVQFFALQEPMLPAASLSPEAFYGIERSLAEGRAELRERVRQHIEWLENGEGRQATPSEAQRRFSFLRMRFNAVLSDYEIFTAALTQRSEHDNGTWLAGLDVAAADALDLGDRFFEVPPLVCYLDRGFGAAIRRARTRLPGGSPNPVAVIRIPRERMVGSGIGSSLVHEVGHQGAALLGLVPSLASQIAAARQTVGEEESAWRLWERWISEIVADLWSVARIGVTSTLGLMAVVSLPRVFVFRVALDDPHPAPWIRVKLSCEMGRALYPDPRWEQLLQLWSEMYPLEGLDEGRLALFRQLEKTAPALVQLMLRHEPQALGGRPLSTALSQPRVAPAALEAHYKQSKLLSAQCRRLRPTEVFAVVGQARMDGVIAPAMERRIVAELLRYWALRRSLTSFERCRKGGGQQVARTT